MSINKRTPLKGAATVAAGLAVSFVGANSAFACETGPSGGEHGGGNDKAPSCSDVVQYSYADAEGNSDNHWHSTDGWNRLQTEPTHGIALRLTHKVDGHWVDWKGLDCTISLASYNDAGPTWETSGGTQHFVDHSSVTLSATQSTDVIKVKLPTDCFGQMDLYWGSTVYDGGTGTGHGPLPSFKDHVDTPTHLITAWNGATGNDCSTTPPPPSGPPTTTPPTTTPPTTTPPKTTPPTTTPPKTTPPTTTPPTPPSSTATPPKTTTTTPPPAAPPQLAHTGADSNYFEISLLSLALFGAGGAAVAGSRRKAGSHV